MLLETHSSTTKKAQLHSMSQQVSALTQWVHDQPWWELVDIYLDFDSASGMKMRSQFERMIDDAKNHRIDLIVTKSVQRFGRSTVENLDAMRTLIKSGVVVYFQVENTYTDQADAELIVTLASGIAEEDNKSHRNDRMWGVKKRVEDGTSELYRRPCYGYAKQEDGVLTVDWEKARVVREIFQAYLDGHSIGGIKRMLEEKHIPSPTGGEKWPARTIDMTYFLEYYLLLAQAVDERRQRKTNAETGNLTMGLEMARTPLIAPAAPDLNRPEQEAADQSPPQKRARQRTKVPRDAVAESLAAEGFVSLLDEDAPEGEIRPPEGGDSRWSGERNAREGLNTIISGQGRSMPEFAKALVRLLDSGQYTFTVKDMESLLDLDSTKINKVIFQLREKGLIETIGRSDIYAMYTFCCGELSDTDYSPEMIRTLNDLVNGTQSVKDKRIGTIQNTQKRS